MGFLNNQKVLHKKKGLDFLLQMEQLAFENIEKAIDKKIFVFAVFVYLQETPYTVDHNILIMVILFSTRFTNCLSIKN